MGGAWGGGGGGYPAWGVLVVVGGRTVRPVRASVSHWAAPWRSRCAGRTAACDRLLGLSDPLLALLGLLGLDGLALPLVVGDTFGEPGDRGQLDWDAVLRQ